jgi:hypothetical protein
MVSKKENAVTDKTFDLIFTHADLVDMMNDPQLLVDEGNVADDQLFSIVVRKENGSEVILKEMLLTDKLIVRFSKKTTATNSSTNREIDVL